MELKIPSAADIAEILRLIEAHPGAAFALGAFTILMIVAWRRGNDGNK